MKGKRILITGANGYIGSTLVTELAGLKNCSLTCLDDFSISREKSFNRLEKFCVEKKARAAFEEASVLDSKKILRILNGIDIVVHLAYVRNVDECRKNPEKSYRVNVEGTKNVIEACQKSGVERLVFPSSILVYGNTEDEKITEESGLFPMNEYARHKLECEKLCEKSSLDSLVLRKANVYGVGFFQQFDTVIPIFVRKALKEKRVEVHGSGLQEKNFLHIRDAMQAYVKAVFSDYRGTINIGGKEDVSINTVAGIVSEKLGAEIEHVPSPRAEPKQNHHVFSSEKAKRAIGYSPSVSLKQGISELVGWAKKNRQFI